MKAVSFLAVLLISTLAQAQQFNAVCKYEYSIEDTGKRSSTEGQFSVSFEFMLPAGKPKNVQFKTTKAPCFDFIGDGDDMKVEGTCIRYIDNGKMKLTNIFTIDRVSGRLEHIFQVNDKAGLVHYGRCVPVSKAF